MSFEIRRCDCCEALRTTGITWAAITGVDGRKLERRVGHRDKATTERYIGVAEDVSRGAIGEPFGPLPASLLEESRANIGHLSGHRARKAPVSIVPKVGLEPKRSGIARQKRAESVEPIEGSEHAEHSQALGIHSVTNKVTKSLEGWGRQFAASLVGWESADDFALRLADGEDFE